MSGYAMHSNTHIYIYKIIYIYTTAYNYIYIYRPKTMNATRGQNLKHTGFGLSNRRAEYSYVIDYINNLINYSKFVFLHLVMYKK